MDQDGLLQCLGVGTQLVCHGSDEMIHSRIVRYDPPSGQAGSDDMIHLPALSP